jgi:hypothetical protein
MVEATLSCIEELERSGIPADYVCLLSGADYPLRPLSHLKAFLGRQPGHEYIECVDPKIEQWVIRGLSVERYTYRHWVSWRKWPKLFDFLFRLQRRFGLKRRPPKGLKVYFGSQWWALTSKTAKDVLARSRDPKIRRFFKYTNVPDEMFFQTIAASIVPIGKIGPMGLTFYNFTSEGKAELFLCQKNFSLGRQIAGRAGRSNRTISPDFPERHGFAQRSRQI